MKLRISIITLTFALTRLISAHAQSFEGTITLQVTSPNDVTSVMTIKDDKTKQEVGDTITSYTLIKDYQAQTTVMLRKSNGHHFGFRMNHVAAVAEHPADAMSSDITVTVDDEVTFVGKYLCKRIVIKNKEASTVAFVTSELDFSLSKYFPELLGDGVDPATLPLRRLADSKGCIIRYEETVLAKGETNSFHAIIEPGEVSIEAFRIDPVYVVLDESSMERLFRDAQQDSVKREQWDAFVQVFGKK